MHWVLVFPDLRKFFVGFNIFFAIASGVDFAVSFALLSPSLDGVHGGKNFEGRTTSHIVVYIVGPVSMVIAILGAYGAFKKNLMALTPYLVCMLIVSLLMLADGVSAAVARSKLESVMEEKWRSVLPLDQASDNVKNEAEALQTSLRCCGLFSYEDWEQNIPNSCLCNQEEEKEGKCQSVDYKNFLWNLLWQKKSVLRQHCLPLIKDSVRTKDDITLFAVFTLFVLALLGSMLCSLMICQLFKNQPPAYQQLYNLPEEANISFNTNPDAHSSTFPLEIL